MNKTGIWEVLLKSVGPCTKWHGTLYRESRVLLHLLSALAEGEAEQLIERILSSLTRWCAGGRGEGQAKLASWAGQH